MQFKLLCKCKSGFLFYLDDWHGILFYRDTFFFGRKSAGAYSIETPCVYVCSSGPSVALLAPGFWLWLWMVTREASRQFPARFGLGAGYLPLLDLFFNYTGEGAMEELYTTPVKPHHLSNDLHEALLRSQLPAPRPSIRPRYNENGLGLEREGRESRAETLVCWLHPHLLRYALRGKSLQAPIPLCMSPAHPTALPNRCNETVPMQYWCCSGKQPMVGLSASYGVAIQKAAFPASIEI